MKQGKKRFGKWMYWFTLCFSLIVVYKIVDSIDQISGLLGDFFDVLTPFLTGAFIAYLLYLPCKQIEKIFEKSKSKKVAKSSRPRAVLTIYLIITLVILVLINFIAPIIVESVTDLVNNFQGYLEKTITSYNELSEDSILKSEYIQEFIKSIQDIDLKQYFQIDRVAEYAINALLAITSVFDVFITLIVSIYILLERRNIVNFFKKITNTMFSKTTSKAIRKYFNDTNEIFAKFIGAQFLDAIVVAVLTTIAMTILGVKYAPLLGILIGVFNMIPYFGAIFAVAISAIITLITGGLSQMIWMLIVVIILQQIDANIINPKIIGQSLEISKILVLMSVTIGGAYFGILGMFLGVPIAAVIKIILNDYMEANKNEEEKKELEEEKPQENKVEKNQKN